MKNKARLARVRVLLYSSFMRDYTLLFLTRGSKIVLAKKKEGFGKDKWNGYGGKVEIGESILSGAVRELFEESKIMISEEALVSRGFIDFYFSDKPEWNQRVHLFYVDVFEGEPVETYEMAPQWFSFDEIPYEKMWVDDKYWLPQLIEGKSVKGEFHLSSDTKEIRDHKIEFY